MRGRCQHGLIKLEGDEALGAAPLAAPIIEEEIVDAGLLPVICEEGLGAFPFAVPMCEDVVDPGRMGVICEGGFGALPLGTKGRAGKDEIVDGGLIGVFCEEGFGATSLATPLCLGELTLEDEAADAGLLPAICADFEVPSVEVLVPQCKAVG